MSHVSSFSFWNGNLDRLNFENETEYGHKIWSVALGFYLWIKSCFRNFGFKHPLILQYILKHVRRYYLGRKKQILILANIRKFKDKSSGSYEKKRYIAVFLGLKNI